MSRYSNYPAQFVHGAGTLTLAQLSSVGVEPGVVLSEPMAAGSVDRGAVIASHVEPRVRLSTADLATLLGTVGIADGLYCSSGCKIQFQQRATNAAGIFLGGLNHVRIDATLGTLWIESLRSSQDDREGAVADCLFAALFDGTNEPLVQSNNVALSGTPAFTSQFHHGPAYLAAAQLAGLRSVQYQTGLAFSAVRADGDYAPKLGAFVERKPILSLTFDKLSAVTSGPNSLVNAALAATLAVYFRKGVHGGKRVSDASPVHIKLSFAAGGWRGAGFQVTGVDDATVTISAEPTTAPSISAASTIP